MKIIYVMDPLCGWCYGNSDNIVRLYAQYGEDIPFEILPAGMWAGTNARVQTPQMASYFMKHDGIIADQTEAIFSKAYSDFLKDNTVVLDSAIPSKAIETIKKIAPEYTVQFMHSIQKARYFDGKDLNDENLYLTICTQRNIDKELFRSTFHSQGVAIATENTFEKARALAHSYPTLLVTHNNQHFIVEQGYTSYEQIQRNIESIRNK